MAGKINDELNTIIKSLKQQGDMAFLNGASEEQISKFEADNNIKLPIKFIAWLLFSDGGECFLPAGIQFYGVAHKPTIDINNDDIQIKEYMVIGALASGDPILCKSGSEEICIYNQEAGRIEDDEKYENFFSFLTDLYNMLGIGG